MDLDWMDGRRAGLDGQKEGGLSWTDMCWMDGRRVGLDGWMEGGLGWIDGRKEGWVGQI